MQNAQTIITALRCFGTPWEKGFEPDCKNCPYSAWEEFWGDYGCDCDRITLDAADLIEQLERSDKNAK